MRCEILSIGTELLLGQIVDTNANFLAQQLPALGLDFELFAHDQRDRFAREVVFGGAKATAGDDDVGAFEAALDGLRKAVEVVADL